MALKDMALSKAEAKETLTEYCTPDAGEAPKYPWGLSLDLNNQVLEKLGITSLPTVGSEMTLTATVKVTRISAYEEQDGAEQCLGLQITAMDLSGVDQSTTPAAKLYGSQDS